MSLKQTPGSCILISREWRSRGSSAHAWDPRGASKRSQSRGGEVERSKAGDGKGRLAKGDVGSEVEGSIRN